LLGCRRHCSANAAIRPAEREIDVIHDRSSSLGAAPELLDRFSSATSL
jgi:hypothetical protein